MKDPQESNVKGPSETQRALGILLFIVIALTTIPSAGTLLSQVGLSSGLLASILYFLAVICLVFGVKWLWRRVRSRILFFVLVFGCALTLLAIGVQEEWSSARNIVLAIAAVVLASHFLVGWIRSHRLFAAVVGLMALLAGIFTFAGFYWRDLALVGFSAGVTVAVGRRSLLGPKDRREDTRVLFRSALLFLAVTWVMISTADKITTSEALDRSPAPQTREVVRGEQLPRTGVALSGGGYRAALLHAGVLAQLEKIGVPVAALSSVSGGSIIASFYASGGSPERFQDAVRDGRFNLKRELVNLYDLVPLLLSQPIPGTSARLLPRSRISRTTVQADLLDRLFLHDMKLSKFSPPSCLPLLICMTDLVKGRAIGIWSGGVISMPLVSYSRRASFVNPLPLQGSSEGDIEALLSRDLQDEPVSRLVAASGAFPLAFPPYPLLYERTHSQAEIDLFSHGSSPLPEKEIFALALFADGGLADNLGLAMFREAARRARRSAQEKGEGQASRPQEGFDVDLILASDGSALPDRGSPRSALGEAGRAIDVVYLAAGEESMTIPGQQDTLNLPMIVLSPLALLGNADREKLASGRPTLGFPYDCKEALGEVAGDRQCVSFKSLDKPAIEFLISIMPPKRARCARPLWEVMEGVKEQADYTCAFDDPYLQSVVPTLEGLPDFDWWRQLRAVVLRDPTELKRNYQSVYEFGLHKLLGDELDELLRAFARTSTLEDRVDPDTAHSIFTLGRTLVMLNASSIRSSLSQQELYGSRLGREGKTLEAGSGRP
jgi:predicted acylesterase/phospholipase RssA